MEKYIVPEMDVVEFENEDIITGSGCTPTDSISFGCMSDSGKCNFDGVCVNAE